MRAPSRSPPPAEAVVKYAYFQGVIPGNSTNGFQNNTNRFLIVTGCSVDVVANDGAVNSPIWSLCVRTPDTLRNMDQIYAFNQDTGVVPAGSITSIMVYLPRRMLLPPSFWLMLITGDSGGSTFSAISCLTLEDALAIL